MAVLACAACAGAGRLGAQGGPPALPSGSKQNGNKPLPSSAPSEGLVSARRGACICCCASSCCCWSRCCCWCSAATGITGTPGTAGAAWLIPAAPLPPTPPCAGGAADSGMALGCESALAPSCGCIAPLPRPCACEGSDWACQTAEGPAPAASGCTCRCCCCWFAEWLGELTSMAAAAAAALPWACVGGVAAATSRPLLSQP